MPENLHIEVRVALMRDGNKSFRSVCRENPAVRLTSIHNVLHGRCGLKKNQPSAAAILVLTVLLPWLPSDFAAALRKEFPKFFAADKAKPSKRGAR